MPTWTCRRCGQKIENFGWGKPPWKGHVCAETKDSTVPLHAAPETEGGTQTDIPGLLNKDKKRSISDFI